MTKFKKHTITLLLAVVALFAAVAFGVVYSQQQTHQTAYAASTSDLQVGYTSSPGSGGYYVAASNKDLSGALVIPSELEGHKIEYIGNDSYGTLYNFNDCKYLTSVVIPDTVKYINSSAFKGCTSLKSVSIPSAGVYISPSAFLGCTSLESIYLQPSGLGSAVFSGCTSLKSVTFAPSTGKTGYFMANAFANCTSLESIDVPEGVNGFFREAFKGCTSLKSVTLSTSFGYLEQDVFKNCTSLQTITYKGTSAEWAKIKGINYIPSNVTIICLGDRVVEISANVDDLEQISGDVTVNYSGYEVVGTYSVNPSGYVSSSTIAFASGTTFTEEGFYRIEVKNSYNTEVLRFRIDKTAPTATLNGVTDGGYTNGSVSLSWTESGATAKLNGNAYTSGTTISAEGAYTIELSDRAGNSTTYTFTIDKTAPVVGSYDAYTNKGFTLTATDASSGVSCWEYRLNDGEVNRQDGATLTLGGNEASNGVWSARVFDVAGNASQWVTVSHEYRETFGNSSAIYNSYYKPSYYVVTLPQRNFPNCYGAYTFAERSSALAFAIQKEWECRVIALDGVSWNYVTATNENTRQIYTDRAELDAVIEKYATKNVSDRKVMGQNGGAVSNPSDENGITRADALTMQLSGLPEQLSGYTGLRFMLAPANYKLTQPRSVLDGNKASATLQFISDGITLREGQIIPLEYGVALKDVVAEQGWYLITERDVCENDERYLIYIDMSHPELSANVTYGNGKTEVVAFTRAYVDTNTGAMRYINFNIASVADNIDAFSMVAINGRNLDARYVWGDELPVLNYSNGYYGAYTVSVYDRSGNALEFVIYIAGEDPSLKHTSLTNETSVTFTVQVNDSFNAIRDIKLFKMYFDGSSEQLFSDSTGVAVNAENLSYKMTVGGKYVFEFTDLYGRTVCTDSLFYVKGLPTATFRGVKEGGKTKNDVSILYAADTTAELYTYSNGEWVVAEHFELAQEVSGNTIKIMASPETTAVYKVLLYITADRNLFTEYTFEIDGILPIVKIRAEDNTEIIAETVTRQNFSVTWEESGYKAYYKKQGALSDETYVRGTVINTAGTWLFTIYDEVRNELAFTVTLDNYVSYTLEGNYTLLEDGSYITRSSFVFSMAEPWSVFEVQSSNGISVLNGQKIDTDGTYIFKVQDLYGNELIRTLIVDKLPPEPLITTIDGESLFNGARTSKAFSVSCEEANVSIVYAFEGSTFKAYEGEPISAEGAYAFKLTDRIGNSITVDIIIDLVVLYRLEGNYMQVEGVYYSRQWMQVTVQETADVYVTEVESGNSLDGTKKISAEGKYNVRVVDAAGNVVELVLIIDKTAPEAVVCTLSGEEFSGGAVTVNEAFCVRCAESGSTITYVYANLKTTAYSGEYLSAGGKYVFTVSDFLGNSAEVIVKMDVDVAMTVNGTYVIDNDNNYVSKNWLSVTPDEEMKAFYIENESGTRYGKGDRISAEGRYTVYAVDSYNNVKQLVLIIDKTAPRILLTGVASNGVTGSDVKINLAEDCASAFFRLDSGDKIAIADGGILNMEGSYVITASDLVGNVASVSFAIDKHVDVTSNVNITYKQIITGGISFQFGEPVTAVLNHDGTVSPYVRGEIREAGEYLLSVTDVCGNEVLIAWQIVPERARGYAIKIPDGVTISGTQNGNYINVQIEDGVLYLNSDGIYSLWFDGDGISYLLDVEVDNVAPSVEFENTGRSIKISKPNKENLSYKLYFNGEETAFSLKNTTEVTKQGSYRLVCEDNIGNVTEYVFELSYLSNVAIALIAVLLALVVVGIVAILVFRFKRKTY